MPPTDVSVFRENSGYWQVSPTEDGNASSYAIAVRANAARLRHRRRSRAAFSRQEPWSNSTRHIPRSCRHDWGGTSRQHSSRCFAWNGGRRTMSARQRF